jgi:Leucine-rich repeat (LRR) protein
LAHPATRPDGSAQPRAASAPGFEAEPDHWEINPDDLGFGETAWADHDEGAPLRREHHGNRRTTISVVEAMRREHFGNLDLDLTRYDLEEMDGDLELPDMDIESLAGLQLCKHLTGLNLSANRIHDINPLRFLRRLEWLDLSGNNIDDADCLEKLTRLEELDLSDNQIEDIDFLENLENLRVVNLSGNPIFDKRGLRERLTARGVLVIS